MIKVQIILTIEDFEEGVECPRNSFFGDPSAIFPFFNGESAYTRTPSPGSSRFQHFHISHNAPYLLPPRTPFKKKFA